jgi:hypothetical protein
LTAARDKISSQRLDLKMGSTTIVRSEPHVSGCEAELAPGREKVRAQLARLLASPLFHHSKHYPSLLRYVVNETLEGRSGHLKERALGVEVFGRNPQYDTNADPVVRTSACEVRKRIAQYYYEAGHETEIRIDLPAGSYVPEFHFAAAGPRPAAATAADATAHSPSDVWIRRWWKWGLGAAAAMALILGIGAAEVRGTPAAVEDFWNPVWASSDTVMVALGGSMGPSMDTAAPGPTFRDFMRADQIAFSDALTMARLTGITREFGKKKLDIRRATTFTLTDLRKGPVILVGAFNNYWTMRLDQELRFTYEWNAETHTGIIRDRKNPTDRSMLHDPSVPYSEIRRDYCVVSRFVNPLTEKMVVVVGGLGRDGTLAAGEFVTDPRYLAMLANRAPRHWERKNFQVLLSTDVVKGNTGPPRILATYFW